MHEPERFSALIGDIYDAALEPSRWVRVLARTACFVGGPAASLYSKDVASKTANVAYLYGTALRYERLYLDRSLKSDPATTGQFFSEIEAPIGAGDLLRYDEFLETRFYRERARPQHLADCLHATLDKSATSISRSQKELLIWLMRRNNETSVLRQLLPEASWRTARSSMRKA